MCVVMETCGYIVRLEDAISVPPYIRSVVCAGDAEYAGDVRGCVVCAGPLSPTVLPNEKFNYRLCIKKLLYNFPLTKWTMVILILQRCENHTLVYR